MISNSKPRFFYSPFNYDSLSIDDTNRKYIEVELIKIVYERYKNNPLMLEHFDSIVDYDILQFVKMGL